MPTTVAPSPSRTKFVRKEVIDLLLSESERRFFHTLEDEDKTRFLDLIFEFDYAKDLLKIAATNLNNFYKEIGNQPD